MAPTISPSFCVRRIVTPDKGLGARGTLFLIVGPSGVGKDSLIDGVRRRLAGNPAFEFPRRRITRAVDAGGEDHIEMTPADFDAAAEAGAFALYWRAHGLGYGLPGDIEDSLRAGRHVIANVSRSVIEDARRRFPPVRILNIFADPEVLSERLQKRGRENKDDIAARIGRTVFFDSNRPDVTTIDNGGELDRAIGEMVAALLAPSVC